MAEVRAVAQPKEVWKVTFNGGCVYGVGVDAQGNVYGGYETGEVVKISPTGTKEWTFNNVGYKITGIAVDAQGNVYTARVDKSIRKISPQGAELWKYAGFTDWAKCVAVDAQGNVYAGSDDKSIRKISPQGTEIWSYTGNTRMVSCVAVDAQGNVYSGNNGGTITKISPEGKEIWKYEVGKTQRAVAVDAQGNVYAGGDNNKVIKLSPDGRVLWTFSGHTSWIRSITVDQEGNIYSGADDVKVIKISPKNAEIWKFEGHERSIFSIAVDQQGNIYTGTEGGVVRKISQGEPPIKMLDKRWNYSAFDWKKYTAGTISKEMLVLANDKTAEIRVFTDQEVEENHLYIELAKEQEYNNGTAVDFYTKNTDGTVVLTQGTKAEITYLYPAPTTLQKNGWNFNIEKWDEYTNTSASLTRINYYGETADAIVDTAMQEGEVYILTADAEKWSTGSGAYVYTKSNGKNYISFLPINGRSLAYIGKLVDEKWNFATFRWTPQKDITGNIYKITPKKEVDSQATTATAMQEKEVYIEEADKTAFPEGWDVTAYTKYNGVNYRTDISKANLNYLLPIKVQFTDGAWNYSTFEWYLNTEQGIQAVEVTEKKAIKPNASVDISAVAEGKIYVKKGQETQFSNGEIVTLIAKQGADIATAQGTKAQIKYLLPIKEVFIDGAWNYSAFNWIYLEPTGTKNLVLIDRLKEVTSTKVTDLQIAEEKIYIEEGQETQFTGEQRVTLYAKQNGVTATAQGTKTQIKYLLPIDTPLVDGAWNYSAFNWFIYTPTGRVLKEIGVHKEVGQTEQDTQMREDILYIDSADEQNFATGLSITGYTKQNGTIVKGTINKNELRYLYPIPVTIPDGNWNYSTFSWAEYTGEPLEVAEIDPHKEISKVAIQVENMQEGKMYIANLTQEINNFNANKEVTAYTKKGNALAYAKITKGTIVYLGEIKVQFTDGNWNYSAFNWAEYKAIGKQLVKITPDKTLDTEVVLDTAIVEGELYIENLELNKNNFTQGNKVKIYATQNGVVAEATAGKAEIEYLLPIPVTVADGNWNYSAFSWYKLKEPGTQYKKIQPDKTLEASTSSSIEFDNLYITNTQEDTEKYNSGLPTRAYTYNNIVMAYAEIEKERLQYLKQPPEPEKVVFIDKDWNLGQFTWYKAEPQGKELLKINKDKTADVAPAVSLENENIYIEKTELAKYNAGEVVKVYAKQSGIVGYASISKAQLEYLKQEPPIPPQPPTPTPTPDYEFNYLLEEKGIFTEVLYSAQGLRAYEVKMDNFSGGNTNTNEGGVIIYDGEKWESINTYKPTTQKPIQIGIVLKKIDDIGVIVAVSGDFKKEIIGYAHEPQKIDADWRIGYNLIMQMLKSYAIIKCNVNIF